MADHLKKVKPIFSHFRKSISTKVMLIILILVLPINMLAITLSNVAIDVMTEQAKISVSNVMENYITNLQHRMENTGYLLWSMKNEETYGTILSRQEETEEYLSAKVKFYHKFQKNMLLGNGADGYFFYMTKLDDIITWDSTATKRIDGEAFVRKEVEQGMTSGWNLYRVDDRAALCMFVSIDNVIYGGWLYLDTLIEQLTDDIQYKQVDVFFDEKPAGSVPEDSLTVSIKETKGNVWLNIILSTKEIVGGISFIYIVMRAVTLASLMLIPVLYAVISRLLLLPLRTVNNAHKMLQEGNLDYRINKKTNSIEYQYSFQSFNQMADQIQTLKIENYEKELDRQNMELKNLQLQIHPHFLLNTFNLLYTLTQRNDAASAQNVILYLSDYFRYIFRSGKNLELFSKEQKLIEEYIEIICVRYPGSVKIEYAYDPEISFVRIPPLLLHNFVENIIKHVVKQNYLTRISLLGQYTDGMVTFMVSDDGPGMAKDQVAALDAKMRQKDIDGEHIGFSNSLKRIKYFFGNTADIFISSGQGIGTCITIQFPYDLEVPDDAFDGK